MSTLQEIADILKISKSAVSYAFSENQAKRGKISEETRKRILELSAKLDYRPSIAGRGLALKRTYNLALLLPESCTRTISGNYLGMFHGVSAGIADSDYNLSVYFGSDGKFHNALAGRRFDGVIVFCMRSRIPFLADLCAARIPAVTLNYRAEQPEIGSVVCDSYSWLDARIGEFARRNFRKIALFCWNRELRAVDEQFAGEFSLLAEKYGLAGEIQDIGGFSPDGLANYDAMLIRGSTAESRKYLFSHPELWGRMAAVMEPQEGEISLPPEAPFFYYDSLEVGRQGAEQLLQMLGGAPAEHRKVSLLAYKEISRNSGRNTPEF